MRVLIVDDEPAARRRLATLLEEIDPEGLAIVGEAADGLAALEMARVTRPDVILLDITMREVDGFDVARHLPEPRPLVIFQTAHHRFALQAFEHEALDFVVKPVRRERLAEALERARRRLSAADPRPSWSHANLAQVEAAFGHTSGVPARLLVRHGAGHRLMPVESISRFEAADGGVFAHGTGTRALTDYSLAELENRLARIFVRVSRADLVHVAHIEKVTSNGDGSLTLSLRDETPIRVSRRRAAEVRQRLGA